MSHLSNPLLDHPIEFIDISPCEISPLISKCQIKVCYVGDEPNRNRSVITKETAKKIAPSLRGAAIVGFMNEHDGDFEEHNRILEISGGELKMKDTTRPYGFVDLGAKVWFQKFLDDGEVEREYMVTEGWLWTGQYPECARVVVHGNNQSMELDEKNLNAHWTKDENEEYQFFIINEAIISKLCILGENYEPCFEGANITAPQFQFSLDDNFNTKLYSMMTELKDLLDKEGGVALDNTTENVVVEQQEEAVEEIATEVVETSTEETTLDNSNSEVDAQIEFKAEIEEKCPECGKPKEECKCGEKKYNLEEVVEYAELQTKYTELETKYNDLVSEHETAKSTIASLTEFKNQVDREKKQEMINSFYMLSDEDKANVIENIDNYSVEDIEAKLSVICVRNKVNFNLEEENKNNDPTVYNLNSAGENDNVPAWVKATREVAKSLN